MGAKIIRRKRKLKLSGIATVLMIISLVLSLFSSLFIRSYNNSLSIKMQSINKEIASLNVENDAIKVEIQTLANKDRVISIANEAGLSMNQNSIVTIASGD